METTKKHLYLLSGLAIIMLALFALFVYKADNYFDTKIKYEATDCRNKAYMIYKNYDDQDIKTKDKDWTYRINDCTDPETKYFMKDF